MKKKKIVLIMGLGNHGGGSSAANYFSSHGDTVIVTDLKSENELQRGISMLKDLEHIRLVLGRHDFKDFQQADLVIKNPGVHPDSPYIEYARRNGARIETDIGIFLEQIKNLTNRVVGVTGTKGKSTTAALLDHIVQREHGDTLFGGNITLSVLDLLEKAKKDSWIILELSSFQLGGIREKRYSPPVAIFTNLLQDHLDYYGNHEDYFRDKAVIYKFQKKGDVLILNRDNTVIDLVRKEEGVRQVSFGLGEDFDGEGAFIEDTLIYFRHGTTVTPIVEIEGIRLSGRHNLYNVLAAISAAFCMDIPPVVIADEVRRFRGLEHRLEFVTSKNNVRFINDSAATTPDAAVQGIESIGGLLTLIAGGSDKGLELQRFVDTINSETTNLILLKGSGTERLLKGGLKKPYALFDNLRDAIQHAYAISAPSTTVLLSPGFASFGMFINEFDRGDQFKALVHEIQ